MKVFVAGATGATGQVFVPMAERAGHSLTFHIRPKSKDKSPLGADPRARVFELADDAALDDAVRGNDAIVSFVGTMKKRFSEGDDYASSDVGSARSLAKAARRAGVPRMLLLSSVGAGGMGAYLKMKLECEEAVQAEGIAWTMFRPSALVSPKDGTTSHHGRREVPPGMGAFFAFVGVLPGLSGVALDYKPIPIGLVCEGFLAALADPARYDGKIVLGRDLWALDRSAVATAE